MEQHVILGTGAVGTALAHVLTEQGKTVRSVNRSGNRGTLPESVELAQADLTDPAQAHSAVKGATVTYQITQPAYHRWAEEFPALQAGIIDAVADAGSSLVIADNLYPYGDHGGQPISEGSAEQATTKKGTVRREVAQAALEAHRQGRLKVAISRPSHYFGPGYEMTYDMVAGKALAGKPMQWLGKPDLPHNFSYVPDVARAMAVLGASEKSWGKVWIPPVMETATVRELSQRVWDAAGQDGEAKLQMIRGFGLRMLSVIVPILREAKEMMYEWDQPYLVDSSAFEREFGMSATSLDDAVAETLAAARAREAVASHK